MALSQNPLSQDEKDQRARVQKIEQEQLAWTNILRLKLQIKQAAKEEKAFQEAVSKLQGQQAQEATRYQGKLNVIKALETSLINAKKNGNQNVAKQAKKQLEEQQAKLKDLLKTEGGALAARRAQAESTRKALTAERGLLKDINKETSKLGRITGGRIGGSIGDIFKTRESKQRQIDIARAASGGGANIPPGAGSTAAAGGTGGGGGGGKAAVGVLAAAGGIGIMGLLISKVAEVAGKIKGAIAGIGGTVAKSLGGPLTDVSGLVSGGTGGGYGIGGGAVSGGGATSLLGGLQSVASQIPFIGGLLGGLIGAFKGIVDLVLGLDQGITNFARNLGISKEQAKGIKEEFRAVAKASDSIVVNETRLMESQAELTKALGIRSRFANEALENNIKLKEIAGLELDTRKALLQTSVVQGKNATDLTKNVLAQTKAFEFETGVAFEFRDILGQASKQAGVLGLIFTKNEKKLTDMLMRTKAMGFELKQLDGLADSFLDFESSITKEMEAQVLTGRDLNLTKAREAALNNDLVTLAKEITSQVGNSQQFLKLTRIEQEALAGAVGMTRDSLADVLRQQEYYKRLGVDNMKSAQAELKLLKEKGLTQEEISKKIGEDAYNYITQTSTAERLAELMNKIKTVFIEFVEKSGILDFITNPQKIEVFVKGMIDRLAGAVNMIGSLIAGIIETVADIAGFFNEERAANLRGLASQVRAGSAAFASGLGTVSSTIGGTIAPSIGAATVAGARSATTEGYVPGPVAPAAAGEQTTTVYVMMDGEVVAKQVAIKSGVTRQFLNLG